MVLHYVLDIEKLIQLLETIPAGVIRSRLFLSVQKKFKVSNNENDSVYPEL